MKQLITEANLKPSDIKKTVTFFRKPITVNSSPPKPNPYYYHINSLTSNDRIRIETNFKMRG